MTTALIIGGALLVGMGLVASQLFRLKDWLARQPIPEPQDELAPTELPPNELPPNEPPPNEFGPNEPTPH
jgi:hypothetical protein